MAEEQTDPEVQKRIIAEFQLAQEKRRIEEEKKKIEKRNELWKKSSLITMPLVILAFFSRDLISHVPSSYGMAIILAVTWLAQIEWRIISVQLNVEKLKAKLENADGTES